MEEHTGNPRSLLIRSGHGHDKQNFTINGGFKKIILEFNKTLY